MMRGRPDVATRLRILRKALQSRADLVALEESQLGRMDYFQRRAQEQFDGRTCAVGHAVSTGLTEMLQQIAEDLPGTRVSQLAAALAKGQTQASLARSLCLTEEYVARRVKPVLLLLLHRRLLELGFEEGRERPLRPGDKAQEVVMS